MSKAIVLNNKALAATSRLQASIGAVADGYWGNNSQLKLASINATIDFDWAKLRTEFGSFSQSQVDGLLSVMAAINAFPKSKKSRFAREANRPSFVAYMLATAWHETGMVIRKSVQGKSVRVFEHTMQPVEEMGKGKGRKYGSRIDIDGSIYHSSLPIYYGRGYVQLTWLRNYVLMKARLGIDFVNYPELALVPANAADIMIVGMLEGSFTSRSLSKYLNYGLYFEFVEARRVINGVDKKHEIAEYAVKFLDCLVINVN